MLKALTLPNGRLYPSESGNGLTLFSWITTRNPAIVEVHEYSACPAAKSTFKPLKMNKIDISYKIQNYIHYQSVP